MAKKPATKASAKAPEGERAMAKKPALVRMERDPEQYAEPHTADVHPDEVENWLATGFRPVEE